MVFLLSFFTNIQNFIFCIFLGQVKADKGGEYDKQVVCRAQRGGRADKRRRFWYFWRCWNLQRFFEKR